MTCASARHSSAKGTASFVACCVITSARGDIRPNCYRGTADALNVHELFVNQTVIASDNTLRRRGSQGKRGGCGSDSPGGSVRNGFLVREEVQGRTTWIAVHVSGVARGFGQRLMRDDNVVAIHSIDTVKLLL